MTMPTIPSSEPVTLPSVIYRYRPITLRSLEELSEGTIWFSAVNDFNDPFEFRFRMDVIEKVRSLHLLSEPSITEAISILSKESANESVNQVNRRLVEMCNDLQESIDGSKIYSEELQNHIDNLVKSAGACCFSSVIDSNLMWGHYTNGHRGIAIGYDTSISPFSDAAPVTYSREFPSINSLNEILNTICFVKSPHWEYESEYRIVSTEHNRQKYSHDRNAICSIIFGACCDEQHQTMVRRLLCSLDVKFSQARLSDVDYCVSIEPL